MRNTNKILSDYFKGNLREMVNQIDEYGVGFWSDLRTDLESFYRGNELNDAGHENWAVTYSNLVINYHRKRERMQ